MRAQVGGDFHPPTAPPASPDSEEAIAARNALIELIEICKDGEYGFRAGAAQMASPMLGQLIEGRANDYREAVRELEAQVVQFGGAQDTGGSASGALHRGWTTLRTAFLCQPDDAVLGACESAEERATARYQAALEQPLPEAVKEIVERQAKEIRLCREQIHDLRERLKG
jgi:uncharacterized protein (TIGR02284 family)